MTLHRVPLAFKPQQRTPPSPSTAHVWFRPDASPTTFERPITRTGMPLLIPVPSPS